MKREPQAIDIAKYIIAFSDSKGDPITNKKLQKLLYYIQAWHLVYFNSPLFNENPEAWTHGPVYPSVYQYFKSSGYNTLKLKEYEDGLDAGQVINNIPKECTIQDESLKLIESVLNKYSSLSSFELEVLSHRENPWLEQRQGLSEFQPSEKEISFSTMKTYYSELLKNHQKKSN